jgi:DNA-binding transcriptional MerR regulator
MTVTIAPMRSGTLAKAAGVSTDTLRFYERRGLLAPPPRDANGYRRYPRSALARVHLIRQALEAGFTVHDLARVLKQRDAGGIPCREVFQIASTRLRELEERLAALTALHERLRQIVAGWQQQLASTPRNERAGLLEGLSKELPAGNGRYTRKLTRPSAGPSDTGDRRRGSGSAKSSRVPSG